MPWLSGEEERPKCRPPRALKGGSKLRLANESKRSSKIKVSHREKPKTGQLVFIFRFFTCPHFYGARI